MSVDDDVKPPRLIGVEEIGDRLCLRQSAVYALFATGALTRIKVSPKRTVALESEVTAFIQRKVAEARQVVA